MKKEVKKGLIGLLTGIAFVAGISGCSGGQADFFNAKPGATEKRVATYPPTIYLKAIHGGQYNFKKIQDPNNNETIGYDILKHHWTEITGIKFKPNTQKIIIPGAKNMSIKQNFLLKDRFNITYELNGQKRLDEYHLGYAGDQCKLANQYIFNEKGKKIKIK